MAKILMRAGILPYESTTAEEMLKRDRSGTNIGNWIYQYGIARTILTENDELFVDNYAIPISKADEINEKYDAYVIPLADAFRDSFKGQLVKYTELIRKLKIPVYLIGAGIRAPLDANIKKDKFGFDNEVRDFIKAVLERSPIVGLRGQFTSDYLSRLGFVEGQDHTVIGCPSMYTFGGDIKIKELNLTPRSLISLNSTTVCDQYSINFINKISESYKNYCFVPQAYAELLIGYFGGPALSHVVEGYPGNSESRIYKEGKVKFFLNAQTWFEYMRKIDFSIGTRLHGNIVATINGTPNITIVKDHRMKELADFHGLSSITNEELHRYGSLDELLQKVDLKRPEYLAKNNFNNYISFLNKNNINHVYKTKMNRINVPMDKLIEKNVFSSAVEPINIQADDIKMCRLNKGITIYSNKIKRQKK